VAIFTYEDNSDRELLELALQVIGMKLTGRIENATNVAMQIVQNQVSINGYPVGQSIQDTGIIELEKTTKPFDDDLIINGIKYALTIEREVDQNWLSVQNESGHQLLHYAIIRNSVKIFDFLLQYDNYLDLNLYDSNGYTPLHFATLFDREYMVEELLQHGSITWATTEFGYKPSEMTSSKKIIEIFNRQIKLESDDLELTKGSKLQNLPEQEDYEFDTFKSKSNAFFILGLVLTSLIKFWKSYRIFLYIGILAGSGAWTLIEYITTITSIENPLPRYYDTVCNPPTLQCGTSSSISDTYSSRTILSNWLEDLLTIKLKSFGHFTLFMIMLALILYHLYSNKTLKSSTINKKIWIAITALISVLYIVGSLLIFDM